jgi:hypothetical protein
VCKYRAGWLTSVTEEISEYKSDLVEVQEARMDRADISAGCIAFPTERRCNILS